MLNFFIFGYKGYKKGLNSYHTINENGNKIIFMDYIFFIANILIIISLLVSICLKIYDLIIQNNDELKSIIALEFSQLILFLLTILLSIKYCLKKTKHFINISRLLFLSNFLFNIVIMFGFGLIVKLVLKVNYFQIINNIINLIVIIFIGIYSTVKHIKITRHNSKMLKEYDNE